MTTGSETNGTTNAAIEAAEHALSELRALLTLVHDHNPNAIVIRAPDGSLRVNAAAHALFDSLQDTAGDGGSARYGLFREDQRTPYPEADLPLARAARRETVKDASIWLRTQERPQGLWLLVTANPLPDGTAVAVYRDVTRERAANDALRAQSEALDERARVNRDLVERLRLSLDDLSTPVLELWDEVLAVPVVGLLDTQRSARMNDRVLDELSARRARFVILDLTGVELVDTSTADRLIKLASSVRLLGAECVVSGIQPAVAQTLVSLGVELDELTTRHNLEHALAWCLRRARTRDRDEEAARNGTQGSQALSRG